MRPRLLASSTALGALALTLLSPVSPARALDGSGTTHQRGAPGSWTRITSGTVASIAEPGLLRTADGVLHVAYLSEGTTTSDIRFTNLSPTGKVLATGTAVTGWVTLPQDPKIVPGPGGGLRLVFGGLRDTDVANPYSAGRMYSAVSDPSGTAWALQPGALGQSNSAYGSYGTGATTLADGVTPVTAYPLNNALTWNVGGAGSDATYDLGDCCLYHSTLAREGEAVWAAFYANGDSDATEGFFVKQLLPAPGPTLKAPQSSTGGDSISPSQATPFVARPGGGLFATYCIGYPTCSKLGLWRVGSPRPLSVPGSKDAREYAMGVGPAGRLWVAWSVGSSNRIRVTHTSAKGTRFGAVTTLKPPKGATVYSLALAGSDGSADLVVGDGAAMYHQQVLPGLSLKASPRAWARTTKRTVTFTVTDAGDRVKGARVSARGASCTTKASGSCTIRFAASPRKHRFWATARHTGYAAAKVRLTQR